MTREHHCGYAWCVVCGQFAPKCPDCYAAHAERSIRHHRRRRRLHKALTDAIKDEE
jgi:hypothetical protein